MIRRAILVVLLGVAGVTRAAGGTVPVQMVGGVQAIVRVSVNGGEPVALLIDTGTAGTVLAPGVGPADGVMTFGFADGTRLTTFARHWRNRYSSSTRGNINGIIGFDLLRQIAWTLDYRRARLTLGEVAPAPFTVPLTIDATQRPMLPFMRVGGVDLGSQLLDTGSSYVRITLRMRARIGVFKPARIDRSVGAFAMERTVLSTPLPVSVGAAGAADVTVQAAGWAALGGSFLNRFVIGMPIGGRELRLTPNPGVPLEDCSSLHRLGLQLFPEDPRRVIHVEPGSIADAAGLGSTTRLVAINGRPIEELGYLGACAEFEDAGRHQWDLQVRSAWGWGAVKEVRLKAE